MRVWKGGRGVKAPYETTHVRIPVPIKARVEELSEAFKDGRLDEVNQFPSLDDAVVAAKEILKKKKSARVSLQSLLTAIYGEEISL